MSTKIKFTIITLFEEALRPYLESSMLYKAQERGIIEVQYVNLRDFGLGPHKSVDDTPYGGGDGMLLRCEPIFAAVESIKAIDPSAEVILPTPAGRVWNQALAREFAGINLLQCQMGNGRDGCGGNSLFEEDPEATAEAERRKPVTTGLTDAPREEEYCSCKHFIIICPHYEGYDERILSLVDHQISLGNYILTGGELPALIIIDSITRLLPGVLGGASSAEVESFSDGDLLEYPQYTKPADFRGKKVPEILLSGHHANIDAWRREQSEQRTKSRKNIDFLR